MDLEKLLTLIEKHQLKGYTIGKLSGLAEITIQNIMNGKTTNPRKITLDKFAYGVEKAINRTTVSLNEETRGAINTVSIEEKLDKLQEDSNSQSKMLELLAAALTSILLDTEESKVIKESIALQSQKLQQN